MKLFVPSLIFISFACSHVYAADTSSSELDGALIHFANNGTDDSADQVLQLGLAAPAASVPTIYKHYLTARDDKEQEQLKDILFQIFLKTEKPANPKCYIGFQIGWYHQYREGVISASPFIYRLSSDSPAGDAGIRTADVITKINGTEFNSKTATQDALEVLANWPADRELQLEIRRVPWSRVGHFIKNKHYQITIKPKKWEDHHDLTYHHEMMFQLWLSKIEI